MQYMSARNLLNFIQGWLLTLKGKSKHPCVWPIQGMLPFHDQSLGDPLVR